MHCPLWQEYMQRLLAAAGVQILADTPSATAAEPPASDVAMEANGATTVSDGNLPETAIPSSHTDSKSASGSDRAEPGTATRVTRLAMLQYKKGKLGKHALLVSAANSKLTTAAGSKYTDKEGC